MLRTVARSDMSFAGCLPGGSLVVFWGRGVFGGLEDGECQGLKVFVEGGASHSERLLGRRADAQAAILEIGWNCAEAQAFDDLESPLNLGIGFKALGGVGARGLRAGPWRLATRTASNGRLIEPRGLIRR